MNASTYTTTQHAPFFRFAWKEARALRAFWLAMFGLTIAVQCLSKFLAAPSDDLPYWLFSTALGAAALFAVGASAIQFSIEHEDETHRFLGGLPMTWQPLFFGKLVVALLSSIALALVLILIGWMIGGSLPSREMAFGAIAFLGFGIVEGIAWGSFFSLRFKAPLVSALLAIVVSTMATQAVVALTSHRGPASLTYLASYQEALPWRLLLVACVFAMNVITARQWLTCGTTPDRPKTKTEFAGSTTPKTILRKSVFTHLLWQTWRETRWLLGLPLLVSTTFVVAFFFLTGTFEDLIHDWKLQLLASAIFVVPSLILIPALHGAFAFYIDQRQHQARFLCEHGVSGRHVWLARHFVWFSGMVVVLLCVTLLPTAWNASRVFHEIQEWRSWSMNDHAISEHSEFMWDVGEFVQEHAFRTTCAILAAYAIGQCVSMFARSGLLACFLTLVLATVLATWLSVTMAWNLSAWFFILPIAIGLLLATWLRAPDWIAERNAPIRWLKPAAAIALPILAIALMLPSVRLAQISQEKAELAANIVDEALHELQAGDTPEARETAVLYREAMELLKVPDEIDPLAKWRKPEFATFVDGMSLGGIASKKIPVEEQDAYQKASGEFESILAERIESATELAHQASLRPTCRFELKRIAEPYNLYHLNHYQPEQLDVMFGYNCEFEPIMIALMMPHPKADNLLTALRMLRHIRSGQTIWIHLATLDYESVALAHLAEWASRDETTKDQIQEALAAIQDIEKLSEIQDITFVADWADHERATEKQVLEFLSELENFGKLPRRLDACFAVDHQSVRAVLEGSELPKVFEEEYNSRKHYLSFLANQLPWERERGFRAVDLTTARNLQALVMLQISLQPRTLTDRGLRVSRYGLLKYVNRKRYFARRWKNEMLHELRTSYLASAEYAARVPVQKYFRELVDTETCWRACRLQLALEMYRRDHESYPGLLAELVPDYLDGIPGDPWSGKGYQWHPVGLDLPHWQRDGNGKLVAAGTPLLWSVGRVDHSMKRNERTIWKQYKEYSEEEQLPSEETPPEKTELVYEMWDFDEHNQWHENDLIFPLQKPAK